MNEELFERLLYEEESTTLDFKKEQYRFAKAFDEEKSELLKDILGFANAWRRTDAYILIGVEDVRGGRGNVVGIPKSDQLDDHALQQFVNNLTKRPVRFHYQAFVFEGKDVGILHIELQPRPIYLKKDYGKLKKGEVYVRRGSSTDPSKPADPDEIAQMGTGQIAGAYLASVDVEFADADQDRSIGTEIQWSAEYCRMPHPNEIPTLKEPPISFTFGGQQMRLSGVSPFSRHELNPEYYRELANYVFSYKLLRKMRLVISNTGKVTAADVRLEIRVPKHQGVGIVSESGVPDAPKRRGGLLRLPGMKFRSGVPYAGKVSIEENEHQATVEIECGSLQPGRKVLTDPFFIGVGQSGDVAILGKIFAGNLPQPQEFRLTITAEVAQTVMSVDDLLALEKPEEDDGDE